jgi:hypothetical protein
METLRTVALFTFIAVQLGAELVSAGANHLVELLSGEA